MNKTLKTGLVLLGVGIFLNILERILWPPIRSIPLGHPMQLPLLYLLGAMMIISPLLILGGIITSIVGAARSKA